jgi:hypothetical protein
LNKIKEKLENKSFIEKKQEWGEFLFEIPRPQKSCQA